jgi:hypothetical protein
VPISEISFHKDDWLKSGPEDVIGTKAIDTAIRTPPQAMSGIAKETPVNRCCLNPCINLGMKALNIQYLLKTLIFEQ